MKWVLIIFYITMGGVESVEFNSELECEVAATAAATALPFTHRIVTVCVGKSE